jgi:hypothetical protein
VSDFVNSVSTLLPQSSDIEKLRVLNKLRDLAVLRYETNASGTSDGAGTWLTLWTATVPTNASANVCAQVIGRGTNEGAAYQLSCGVQDFGGTTSLISGGFALTVVLEDAAAMNARWQLAGSLLALQVRDDAAQAMKWRAFISAVTAV